MNILQIFPGKIWGGAEQYVADLGKALESKGHNVEYAGYDREALVSQLNAREIKCELFRNCPGGLFGGSLFLADLVRKADIVHVHHPKFVPVVARTISKVGSNARIVLTRHETRRKKIKFWNRKYYDRVGAVICVSDCVRDNWTDANKWLPQDKCVTVLNSIPDNPSAEVPSLREKYDIPAGETILMFCGRIRKSKGCTILIDALAKISRADWHLVLVGDCYPKSYEKELSDMAAKRNVGDRVHFYGSVKNARDLMRQADIGVAPSIVREAGSLVILEFLQAGACVIASNSGSQSEYILSGKTGFLVKAGDTDKLAEALDNVLQHRQLRHDVAAAGKTHFINDLSYDKFIAKVEAIYLQAISSSPTHSN